MKKGLRLFICLFVVCVIALTLVSCGFDFAGEIRNDTGCQHVYSDDFTCNDRACLLCGEIARATTDHRYVNGVCTYCGARDPSYSSGQSGSSKSEQESSWKQTWRNDSKLSKLPVPSFSNCTNITSQGGSSGAVFSGVSQSEVNAYMSSLRQAGWSVSQSSVNYFANKSGVQATFGYVNNTFTVVVN